MRVAMIGRGKYLAHYVRHTAVRAYAGRYASSVGSGASLFFRAEGWDG
jgi:hypothetical protein